jgi:hypothetical protein
MSLFTDTERNKSGRLGPIGRVKEELLIDGWIGAMEEGRKGREADPRFVYPWIVYPLALTCCSAGVELRPDLLLG